MSENSGAHSDGTAGGGGGWFGSWIQAAREKSAEAISFVKKDLAGFTSTMQDDGARVATTVKEKLTQENATQATEKVRQGVSTLLGGLSKALVVEPKDDYRPARIVGGEAVLFDRQKARLHALQTNPSTYTVEPVEERFTSDWKNSFTVENKKGEISELLVSNSEIRALYTQMVPITVSNVDFWSRYYYRLMLLEEDEERRRALKKRAELSCQLNNDDKLEDDIDWDDDDDDDDAEIVSSKETSSYGRVTSSETSLTSPADTTDKHSTDDSSDSNFTPIISAPTNQNAVSIATPLLATPQPSLATPQPSLATPRTQSSSSSNTLPHKTDETHTPNLTREESKNKTSSVTQDNKTEAKKVDNVVTDTKPVQEPKVKVGESLKDLNPQGSSLPKELNTQDSGVSPPESGEGPPSVDISEENSPSATPVVLSIPAVNLIGENISARTTPSDAKESTDDDWEKDFDVDVTDEELKQAQQAANARTTAAAAAATATDKTAAADDKGEDWEEW